VCDGDWPPAPPHVVIIGGGGTGRNPSHRVRLSTLRVSVLAGKISGKRGAAEILGMNPSTLASRMRALGIKR